MLADAVMPNVDGMELPRRIRDVGDDVPYDDRTCVDWDGESMKRGADDSFHPEDVRIRTAEAIEERTSKGRNGSRAGVGMNALRSPLALLCTILLILLKG